MNCLVCSGVEVMSNVRPDSPSLDASTIVAGARSATPNMLHPHSMHIITYRYFQRQIRLVLTYLLMGKLMQDLQRIARHSMMCLLLA
jgi:hypothetical protein